MTHTWNPDGRHRHPAAQAGWVRELIGKHDLGCGEGKVTAEIAARFPSGSVLGLDVSRDMIAFARERLL